MKQDEDNHYDVSEDTLHVKIMMLKQEIPLIVYEDFHNDLIDKKSIEGLMSHMHHFAVVSQIHLINIERLNLKVRERDRLDSGIG